MPYCPVNAPSRNWRSCSNCDLCIIRSKSPTRISSCKRICSKPKVPSRRASSRPIPRVSSLRRSASLILFKLNWRDSSPKRAAANVSSSPNRPVNSPSLKALSASNCSFDVSYCCLVKSIPVLFSCSSLSCPRICCWNCSLPVGSNNASCLDIA